MIIEKTIDEIKINDILVYDLDLFILGGRYLAIKITDDEIITERWDCGQKFPYENYGLTINKFTWTKPIFYKSDETFDSWKAYHKII
jgi:hypothetical protein